MSAEFLLAALVVALVPGTGVLYTLAVGLAGGTRAAAIAALGCTLGILPHAAAAVGGAATALQATPSAFHVLRLMGAAYLLWLAADLIRHGLATAPLATDGPTHSNARLIIRGVTLNLLNPKLSLFLLAFLPQFVDPNSRAPGQEMIALAATFMAITFITFLGYGALAAGARRHVLERPAVMEALKWLFALTFTVLAVRLALVGTTPTGALP